MCVKYSKERRGKMESIIINNIEYKSVTLQGRTKLISKSGDAINPIRKNQKATTHLNKDGYLCFGGGVPVHMYVAHGWVDGYFEGAEVNHIDYNRQNNNASNLEWISHSDNVKHSSKVGHYQRFAERNSNFKNNTLKTKLQNNPELKELYYARKGKQNGRCVSLIATNEDESFHFDYIRECAQWLKDRFNLRFKIPTIHQHILKAIKENSDYQGFSFALDSKLHTYDNQLPSLSNAKLVDKKV